MTTIFDFPLALFAVSVVILWLSVQIGALVGAKLHPVRQDERDDLELVINSGLTLLALIIGFSFSMAVSRYDQRKDYEEEEANAIGTEYLRADLLSPGDAAAVRTLLRSYLDERLLFYTTRDRAQLEQINAETAILQDKLWSSVRQPAHAEPNQVVALVVSGMNDVINRQGYTQAAWWNRIPTGAWALMLSLAICCSLLIGYGAHHRGKVLFMVLPFLVSIAFFLIADIDSPRRGVIRVAPRNLISLSESLRK